MGLVAVSLALRTAIYCVGVWFTVHDASRVVLIPLWLAVGEFSGIALVWVVYTRSHGLPRPVLSFRFLAVFLRRGRSVGLIHFCQAVLVSVDVLVVGLMSAKSDVGLYDAPLRIIAALMAFGTILQQGMLPALARNWRVSPEAGRHILDFAVRVLVAGFLPLAVGGTLLAEPLVRFLLSPEYQGSAILLAVGVWRAPFLGLAFLYQASLIAMNHEKQGLNLLIWGSVLSAPLIALCHWGFGLAGASMAVVTIGLALATAGYFCLLRLGRAPSAHHHLVRPLFASLIMALVCLFTLRWHVMVAVVAGGLSYLGSLKLVGGLDHRPAELRRPQWAGGSVRIDPPG